MLAALSQPRTPASETKRTSLESSIGTLNESRSAPAASEHGAGVALLFAVLSPRAVKCAQRANKIQMYRFFLWFKNVTFQDLDSTTSARNLVRARLKCIVFHFDSKTL